MIDTAHEKILSTLRESELGLQDVMDYGRADKITTPAAILNLEHFEPADTPEDGSGCLAIQSRWELFLLMPGKDRHERELRALAGAVARLVHGNRFGLKGAPAHFLLSESNEFEPQFKGCISWRVEFELEISLGESVWNPNGMKPETVLVSHSPRIGTAHEAEYQEVGNEL